nr:MerR family transcriptional regulator [Streptomyces sp. NBC_00995]
MNGDGDTYLSIGELARLAGLTVKTVRAYSDRGIVPPAGRTPAGYRRYGPETVARLRLVRTLRALGLGLPAIREALDRDTPPADLAAAHAEALAVQIRVLTVRRAVLMAAARRESTPEELERMHRLAALSEDERRVLTREFLDEILGGPVTGTALAGVAASLTPLLSDNPAEQETQAWIELAELCQDPGFRSAMRRTAARHVADRAERGAGVPVPGPEAVIRDHTAPARAAGITPGSPQAGPVVDAVTAAYARRCGRPDDAALRQRLLAGLDTVIDPRWERYLQLLAVVNRWPAPEPLSPALDWFCAALRARTAS